MLLKFDHHQVEYFGFQNHTLDLLLMVSPSFVTKRPGCHKSLETAVLTYLAEITE